MGQTTYEEELAAKKELVESYIGKYCKNIHDVAGMYYPFHYRNKVHAVFGRLKDEVIAGTYSEGTHFFEASKFEVLLSYLFIRK